MRCFSGSRAGGQVAHMRLESKFITSHSLPSVKAIILDSFQWNIWEMLVQVSGSGRHGLNLISTTRG